MVAPAIASPDGRRPVPDRARAWRVVLPVALAGAFVAVVALLVLRDGAPGRGVLSAAAVGALVFGCLVVVSALRRAATTVQAQGMREETFRALLANSSDVIAVMRESGDLVTVTGAVETMLGRSSDDLVGRPLGDLVHPDDDPNLAPLVDRGEHRFELRLATADNGYAHVEILATDLREDPNVDGIVLTCRDVTERKALEERLRHRAMHDPLTHLANRALFYDRVEQAVSSLRGSERRAAVLFLDLDDFKLVNDRLGHAAGDEVLVAVAARLRNCVRAEDTVARLGGDEFGVLLEDVSGNDEPVHCAQRILTVLETPVNVHGTPMHVSPSIGVAIAEAGDVLAEDVLHRADVAMYQAKKLGKSRFAIYESALAEGADAWPGNDRAQWFAGLDEQREEILSRLALAQPVVAAFQPILDLRSGEVTGYEALARFPSEQPRSPDAWFAQAHRCGLGVRLELAAVRAALASGMPPDGASLSINLSPSALQSESLMDVLPKSLDGLIIEITENELVTAGGDVQAKLAMIRELGARIAVDDAGAGYAGFQQLMRVRPDVIKLDRTIVAGIHEDRLKQALVESFVRFGDRLGAVVCAEGVEEAAELETLARLDVASAQGYLIARPGGAWAGAADAALAACRAPAGPADGAPVSDEDLLADVARRLSRDAGPERLAGAVADGRRLLGADLVQLSCATANGALAAVSYDGPGPRTYRYDLGRFPTTADALAGSEPRQLSVLDRSLPASEVECMLADGLRSVLLLPITGPGGAHGLLEIGMVEEHVWTRTQVNRAWVLAAQMRPELDAWLAAATMDQVA